MDEDFSQQEYVETVEQWLKEYDETQAILNKPIKR